MVRGFDEDEKVIRLPRHGRPKTKQDDQETTTPRRMLTEVPTCHLGKHFHKTRSYRQHGHR